MGYRGDTGDPYVDSQTGVLGNLAGIKDVALLEDYEGEMSIVRLFELAEAPLGRRSIRVESDPSPPLSGCV